MYVLHGVHDWGSQVIHMVLAELGVPFRFNALDFQAGDFDAPSFRALNPFGRVPVLETPDGPIFETAAILLYLSERHSGLAPRSDASDRAQFLIWFKAVLSGDLGLSIGTKQAVLPLILERFSVSAIIVLVAVLLATLIAVPVGLIAAWKRRGCRPLPDYRCLRKRSPRMSF